MDLKRKLLILGGIVVGVALIVGIGFFSHSLNLFQDKNESSITSIENYAVWDSEKGVVNTGSLSLEEGQEIIGFNLIFSDNGETASHFVDEIPGANEDGSYSLSVGEYSGELEEIEITFLEDGKSSKIKIKVVRLFYFDEPEENLPSDSSSKDSKNKKGSGGGSGGGGSGSNPENPIDNEIFVEDNSLDLKDNVLVLYNENYVDGLEIAKYYANARGINHSQICGVKLPVGVHASAEQLLGARKTIIENCICPKIKNLMSVNCDVNHTSEIAQVSPFSHLVLIKGIPSRIYGTLFESDDERPVLGFWLSYLIYHNDSVFTIGPENYESSPYFIGNSWTSVPLYPKSIWGYSRPINVSNDRIVAYGQIEALTKERTFDLIDRIIDAENQGVQGNFLYGLAEESFTQKNTKDPRINKNFKFLSELTSSTSDICYGYLYEPYGKWNYTLCRLGGTLGEIPGESGTIPRAINAGLYLGSEYEGNWMAAFDGFANMLNWHKSEYDCVELCKDFSDPKEQQQCVENSTDYYKEINTDCVGVAPGFIGWQYRSYTVQYYGIWPPGWRIEMGESPRVPKTPPIVLEGDAYKDSTFTDDKYLRIGTLDKDIATKPTCVFADGSEEICNEVVGVDLKTDGGYRQINPSIDIGESLEFTVRLRRRGPASENFILNGKLVLQFDDGAGGKVYSYNYGLKDLSSEALDWKTEEFNITAKPVGNGIAIGYYLHLYAEQGLLESYPERYVEFDGIELIESENGKNLIDISTGSFNLTGTRETSWGDWAANVIDRLGGIGFWGSSSHHWSGGNSFANAQEFLGAFYSGRSLGESLIMTGNRGASGLIYADPLYRPVAVKIYVNNGTEDLNHETGNGKILLNNKNSKIEATYKGYHFNSSSDDKIYINALHGQGNINLTNWQISLCYEDIEFCDGDDNWEEILSGKEAVFGYDTEIKLMKLVKNPNVDKRVIMRLRVWNPGEENNDLKNYAYFYYDGDDECKKDNDCKYSKAEVCSLHLFPLSNCNEVLTPLCHPDESKCVQCVDDSNCEDLMPACNQESSTCVECTESSFCTDAAKPYCGEGFKCTSEESCISDNDCGIDEYCWINGSCAKVECVEDKDCEDFDDCSKDTCEYGECVFERFSNEKDCYSCADFKNCFRHGSFTLCGGSDVDHNGSVSYEDALIMVEWWSDYVCNETNLFCNYSDINRNSFRSNINLKRGVDGTDTTIFYSKINQTCKLEPWKACELNQPSEEICDKLDNDCDGDIDEECENKGYSIWAISDTHFDNTKTDYDWASIFSERLDNMKKYYSSGMILGDIVLWRTRVSEIKEFDEILKEKGIKNDFAIITGNHDVLHGCAACEGTVQKYYLENISDTHSHNFTTQIGNVLFIMMGDEGCRGSGESYGVCKSTVDWFNKTVLENQDKIIVVGTHEHPCFAESWVECLPFSNEFEEILNQSRVDVWVYGHTHGFSAKEINFKTGKILFLNDGANECSSRSCYMGEKSSMLITFKENSNEVNLRKISFSNQNDTTPTFSNAGTYNLTKNFCLEDCIRSVSLWSSIFSGRVIKDSDSSLAKDFILFFKKIFGVFD